MSEAILTRLPLSWAIVEAILRSRRPSWSHLGPSWTLLWVRPPPSKRMEGGEVNLPSRERQEVGKGNALDHLRQEGWWDLMLNKPVNPSKPRAPKRLRGGPSSFWLKPRLPQHLRRARPR